MRTRPAWILAMMVIATGCGSGGGGGDAGADPGLDVPAPDLGMPDPGGPGDTGRPDAGSPDDAIGDAPGPDDVPPAPDASDVPPEDTGPDTGLDAGVPPCPRVPGPDDAVRKVVVSLPFHGGASKARRYEVLELATDGTLLATGATFQMTRRSMGNIAFTPDGRVGMVAGEDGALGVFRFEDDGSVTVVAQAFEGSFYASDVVMDPDGNRAWVLDTQWRNNGGGVYSVRIGCDGTPVDEGLFAPGKLVSHLLFDPGNPARALAVANDILDSTEGHLAHLLSWGETPSVVAGSDAFGDSLAITSAASVTPDRRYLLIGDNHMIFDETDPPNRVAAIEVLPDRLELRQVLAPIEDPVAIVASPFGDAALVASGFGDDAFVLTYAPDANPPFENAGPVAWGPFGKVQLPGGAVMVERGALKGLVMLTEVRGVRLLRFEGDGTVTDLGMAVATDDESPGAIGIQP